MIGRASSIRPLWWLLAFVLSACSGGSSTSAVPDLSAKPWRLDEGGVIRGDVSKKELALIFTGGSFGDGATHILDTLAEHRIKASFFFTGEFLHKKQHDPFVKRIIRDGHYLGPHSDAHRLYASWNNRNESLVSTQFFRADLQKNIDELRAFGADLPASKVIYFIPPFEYYNREIVEWAHAMGVLLFNYSPGANSQRDWVPEGDRNFVSSRRIIDDILAYEQRDPHGLNGSLLLLHVGSKRKDKVYLLLEELVTELTRRGYRFARVDALLAL